ncbi:hypothetical protein OIV83_000086 [Microbotryomycetes sp. JL201]|nr:hypothetical protein OIV83_000086 [Microbotryomycetes sp. JL201]
MASARTPSSRDDTALARGVSDRSMSTGDAVSAEAEFGARPRDNCTRSSDSAQTLHHPDESFTERQQTDLEKAVDGKSLQNRQHAGTIVIDWDEDDPEFPQNCPLSSTMIAPAANQVAKALDITAAFEEQMITSIFVLAYACGPLLLGPSSELFGRAIVLQISNVVYIIFNLVCAFATTKSQYFAFRFLAGFGGSAPLSIGAGVLGDLWRPEERGTAASLYSLGPLIGPAIGPCIGGWVAERVPKDGYKWIFISSSAFGAGVQIVGFFALKEMYAPVLLQRRANAKRKELGLPPHSDQVQTVHETKGKKTLASVISVGLLRPFLLFGTERIINVLALYVSVIYGMIYLVNTTTTSIFVDIYGQSVGIAGTQFVSQGIGLVVAAQINGRLLDVVYRKLKERNNGVGKPEFRLPMLIPASIILPLGIFLYGWAAQERWHWIGVDFGMALLSFGLIGVFQSTNLYLVDTFGIYAASALAATTFFRSIAGFGFPLFAPYLFRSLGYGGGSSLLAGICIVVGCPAGPVLFVYGERIRSWSKSASRTKS